MKDFDVVIAGGGVNGLACASLLTKYNLSVCVLERNPWVGGGAVTREVTLPGFKHDMFGSSHVWIHCNPDFQEIKSELEQYGLKYIWSEDQITGHPDKSGGPGIVIYKSIDKTVESIAQYSEKDAVRYREIYDDFELVRDGFLKAFFSPPSPPSYMAQAMETSKEGLKRLREFSLSARAWVDQNFENEFVKGVMLNWAMAPQILPEQEGAGQSCYIMIPAIHMFGQSIPKGGSMMLPIAMQNYINDHGGQVLTEAAIREFIVENGEARGCILEDGREIRARKAVVSALEPKQTFRKFVRPRVLDDDFLQMVDRYSFGKITICRVHLALTEAPRFTNGELMSSCPFHRIVDSEPQLIRQYAEIAQGIPPSDPFLWSACWTLMDPSRAPEGKHTLIFDTFVSNWLADGRTWEEIKQDYAHNVLLKKLQQYAPNINEQTILGEYIETRESLEAANPCFVDGITTGGERIQAQLGYFRPFPGYAHYRSPIRNLYMTGPHCHPGGAISAMGTITANVMLEDMGLKQNDY
ncbi:phytoene desaturase family protein [Luteithermobacter gelatinilyticus]|uniref:phytoene desaturase family protein n=1 Tax=Luteithermobacter gelatinilyticus TaxID=2582913 RepID=UPI001107027C|nr:NAD(P)/FAD-dependent oxidoreductase [Luteithermobacter gelatinilyticus]